MAQVCRILPPGLVLHSVVQFLRLLIALCCFIGPQQKVVLRVPTMTDDKIKQKAIEAVADIYGNILHPPSG